MKLTQREIEALKQGLTADLIKGIKEPYRSVIRDLLRKTEQRQAAELFVDGAADLHSKCAGIGGVLYRQGEELYRFSRFLPDVTNNVAEYEALLEGLRSALELGITEISVRSDSELVVKQLLGEYRVKHPNMKKLYDKVNGLLERFSAWKITHIPREQNKVADKLSKEGMRSQQ